jgi:dephospho-CoA kinase
MSTPLRLGLTGGIACGKSQVLARLARAGFHTLDLDVVAHEVMAPGGAAYDDVVAAFGPGIRGADGAIDRTALGAIVFRDEAARRRLNEIVHPRVWAEEADFAARFWRAPGSVVVTDAALLVEAGLHLRFDRLVVVHCPPEVQLRRLMTRDGMGEAAARARVESQMPIEEKRRFAHFQISTEGSLGETQAASDELAREVHALSSRVWPTVELHRNLAMATLAYGPRCGPRGLSPSVLLAEIARVRSLQMEGVKSLLSPPTSAVWYRAARADENGPRPATLAGALVLWQLARGVADEGRLLAAMASVARLTHKSPAAVGNACVFALALLDAASPPPERVSLAERLTVWRSMAAPWAAGSFPDELEAVLRAAEAYPGHVVQARAAATRGGGEGDLAGALAGLRAGSHVAVSRLEEDAVEALLRVSARPERG